MDKEEVINCLEEFKDKYGESFSSACPEAMSIIEIALSLYYENLENWTLNYFIIDLDEERLNNVSRCHG